MWTPWFEVSKDEYYRMLEVLPPARMQGTCFAVGEPLTHTAEGPIHEVFIIRWIKGKPHFFGADRPLFKFDPRAYREEIKNQLTTTED